MTAMTQRAARRPSIWTRVLAAAGAATVIGASIVLSTTPVAAAGLETFSSCDDLRAHLDRVASDARFGAAVAEADTVGGSTASTMPALPTTGEEGRASDDGSGGTNTQVEGIDELDIVDVLGDGRILAARGDRIVLVDAAGEQILAALPVANAPQITFDEERATLWAVSTDGLSTTLTRSLLDGSTFAGTSTWTVDGRLVDLRRSGDRVHLDAVDEEILTLEDGVGAGSTPKPSLPFGGTSPVPCDQVLHSPLPGGPATTLVATFAATGDLAPIDATEIVGAGDNVLVTDTALYVSTPTYDTGQLVTGIHRFDLRDLSLSGSGSVPGRLLNQFSLDEHAGHLRAAVTVGDSVFVGPPMPVEGDGGVGVSGSTGAGAPAQDTPLAPDATVATTVPDTTEATEPPTTPVTTEPPTTTVTTEPPTITVTTEPPPTTVTTEPPTTATTVEEPSTVPTPTVTTEPVTVPGEPLNEIVTFDLDGALDVVGRSARFGHPGETLQGIRFAGDIAYAVTFLQTDPLYVIDLSKAAFPRVLGQIEIPGFSAYLHPISATQVIGFGPGGAGQIVGRLFDIRDPASPRLLDTVDIAEDSAIIYDHHALRVVGDRLVIAANAWVIEQPAGCGPTSGMEQELNDLYLQMDVLYRALEGQPPSDSVPPAIVELQARIDALTPCVYPATFPQARIVLLAPNGSSLQVQTIETDASDAQRVLPVPDGYLVVGAALTSVGTDGATRVVLDAGSTGDQPMPVDASGTASGTASTTDTATATDT